MSSGGAITAMSSPAAFAFARSAAWSRPMIRWELRST